MTGQKETPAKAEKTEKPQHTINQKIADLNRAVDWFYGDEFELEQASEKYEQALGLAQEIERDLKTLENKIELINRKFSED